MIDMDQTPQQMKRNFMLAGVLLLGASLVTLGVALRPVAPKPKATDTQRTAAVEVDDNQFQPAELTVKQGTKVTWRVNGGDDDAYALKLNDGVDLPGFGSGEFKGSGTYTFQFDRVGTYRYHNDLIPTGNGLIHVVE